MSCLGDVVAALVDGELNHAARERAQRHLAHCDACRAEVDVQRRLKARLSGACREPAPSDALTARLLGLRPGDDALGEPPLPPARPVSLRPAAGPRRPLTRRASTRSPVTRSSLTRSSLTRGPVTRRRGLRRRAVLGSAVAVLGVVLALGGPQLSGPSTPVDPGTDSFVVDFVSSTSDVGGLGSDGSGR